MTDREINGDFVCAAAILEIHLYRVANVAQLGVKIVFGVLRVFLDLHFLAQRVDAWVAGNAVFVIRGGQPAENQRHGNHVLDAVITVSRVIERPGFVDDSHAGFLRFNNHFFDVINAVFDLRVQCHTCLDGCL